MGNRNLREIMAREMDECVGWIIFYYFIDNFREKYKWGLKKFFGDDSHENIGKKYAKSYQISKVMKNIKNRPFTKINFIIWLTFFIPEWHTNFRVLFHDFKLLLAFY